MILKQKGNFRIREFFKAGYKKFSLEKNGNPIMESHSLEFVIRQFLRATIKVRMNGD